VPAAVLGAALLPWVMPASAADGDSRRPPDLSGPTDTGPADAAVPAVSDARIRSLLITTYSIDKQLSPFDIGVEVEGDAVTLSGAVDSAEQRDLAARLAEALRPINRVANRIRVATPDAPAPRSNPFYRFVEQTGPRTQVKLQLLWQDVIDGMRVDLSTHGDTMVLFGEVPSEAARQLAERVARRTIGIGDVENRLRVNPHFADVQRPAYPPAHPEPITDDWITTRVTASLRLDRDVDARGIAVSADHGVLSLSGSVPTDAQKREAGDVADAIVGVQRVENRLGVSGSN
jgi:osmotically-inducible protein OsmY